QRVNDKHKQLINFRLVLLAKQKRAWPYAALRLVNDPDLTLADGRLALWPRPAFDLVELDPLDHRGHVHLQRLGRGRILFDKHYFDKRYNVVEATEMPAPGIELIRLSTLSDSRSACHRSDD